MSITTRSLRRFCATAIALAAVAAIRPLPAAAHDTVSPDGTLKFTDMWTRATPAGAKVAGGFIKITNLGTELDRLTGGTLATAGTVQVHEMSMRDGVMKMQELPRGLEIKPGETVELKPGGYHLMFIDLKAPVKEGDKLEGTLIFERAGTVAIHYHAVAIGASNGAAEGHKH